jgi:tRNA pseudouridine38-40 synthase
MRIALGLEYDGAALHGWQSQPHGITVQDAVERAVSTVAGERIRTAAAGRTDAGVHALAQVAHFDTTAERPLQAWVRGVNAHLPETIAVRWAHPVGDGFHARFSARARHYRYVLLNRPVRPALLHGRVGWHHACLDAAAMESAAARLVGAHDFSAFRAAECQAKTPRKTLYRADVRRDGDVIQFDFCANAFLHHMVRNIVGALILVGKGERQAAWLAEILASREKLTRLMGLWGEDASWTAGGALIENNVIWDNEGWCLSMYKSDNGIIRVDHAFNDRQTISARVFLGTGEATAFAGSVYKEYFQSVPSRQPNYALQFNSVFTPRLVNQLLSLARAEPQGMPSRNIAAVDLDALARNRWGRVSPCRFLGSAEFVTPDRHLRGAMAGNCLAAIEDSSDPP